MIYKISLPKINKDLAYFCGLILGNGSLPNAYSKRPNGKLQKRYIISFFCTSNEFLKEVYQPLFFKLFHISPKIYFQKKSKNCIVYNCRIESKHIFKFLESINLIRGRKAKIARVPNLFKKHKLHVLAGLLDTDDGKKGSGFGFSTASKSLALFCSKEFKYLNLSYHSCPWFYKGHNYHQIYVHKKDVPKILESIPLKNKDKICLIKSYASVAQPG